MNDKNFFDEGKRAAAKNIPAQANPYRKDSPENARWAEGHASVATAVEASESEGI
jgi:hypothetical protein